MMRRFVLFFLMVCAELPDLLAQGHYRATVVDAATHEPLPFASVYLDRQTATITNVEGSFAIDCDSADVLRFTYVGYEPLYIQACRLHEVVALKPQSLLLREVRVVPIVPMINKICKETLRQMQKHRNKDAEFFYRQTAFTQDSCATDSDAVCYEFLEAFLKGHSAVSLHDLQLVTGRYAGIQPDSAHFYSYFGNFYTFSQIEVASTYAEPYRGQEVVPLFRHFAKYYDYSYYVIDDDGRGIYVITFEPKDSVTKGMPVLAATLYVDAETLHLRRIVGEGRNAWMMTQVQEEYEQALLGKMSRIRRYVMPINFVFDINLTEQRGFPEVQSAFVEARHGFRGKLITNRSVLYNVTKEKQKKKEGNVLKRIFGFLSEQYRSGRNPGDLAFGSEIHKVIERQGYDPEFWNKNETVLRTPLEQKVLELFERQNLFGIMGTEAGGDSGK